MNKLQERLDARKYKDAASIACFKRGYGHGYEGSHRRLPGLQDDPNAYSAGYWDGVADRKAKGARK